MHTIFSMHNTYIYYFCFQLNGTKDNIFFTLTCSFETKNLTGKLKVFLFQCMIEDSDDVPNTFFVPHGIYMLTGRYSEEDIACL